MVDLAMSAAYLLTGLELFLSKFEASSLIRLSPWLLVLSFCDLDLNQNTFSGDISLVKIS